MRSPSPTPGLFLEGRNDELADQLQSRMLEAAADQRFEEAAQLRDAMRTVQAVRERQQQKMASAELGDRDVFGVKVGASGAVVQVFIVRGGRVIERVEFIWATKRRQHQGVRGEARTDVRAWSRPRFSSSTPIKSRHRRFMFPRHRPTSRSRAVADATRGA